VKRGEFVSAANVALIQRFEDSFVAGDIDDVLSILDDDVVVHEAPSVPYPGDHRGKAAFLKLAEAFNECWDLQTPLDLQVLPAGDDRVIGLVQFDAIARATGTLLTFKLAEIYTVRDGKITDLVVHYWDTHAMHEATNGVKVLEGEPA
jgi:ketosteroid isomerase-like protein